MKKNNYIQAKNTKGFSLIELLISVAILTILMLATTDIFAKSFGSYTANKKLESTISESQFLMNLLAKELRTSTVVSPSSEGTSSNIKFYEHSKGECVQYRFTGSTIEAARTSAGVSFSSCNNASNLSGLTPIGIENITGSFYVVPSRAMSPGPGRVGRVTMTLVIQSSGNPTVIQTTTSLRDYGHIGLQ